LSLDKRSVPSPIASTLRKNYWTITHVSLSLNLVRLGVTPCALRDIAHDHYQAGPGFLGELRHSLHDALVDFAPVWLSKSDNQDAMVRHRALVTETFVSRNEQATVMLDGLPKHLVFHPLVGSATIVANIVADFLEILYGH
jgi:hypothetical protein